MNSIDYIPGSDGTGNPSLMTVQAQRSPGASTINVNTVTGVPAKFFGSMGTPHTFTDPVTSEIITVVSEATAVDFAGHIDDGKIEIDAIAPGYTDNGSEAGDIVIVRPTVQWADNLKDVLEVSHNQDGSLKAGSVTADTLADSTRTSLMRATIITGDGTSPVFWRSVTPGYYWNDNNSLTNMPTQFGMVESISTYQSSPNRTLRYHSSTNRLYIAYSQGSSAFTWKELT